jgi:phosphinothricin acetyltransferase
MPRVQESQLTPAIRLACVEDLAAINAVYNHYVLHSTCTYQEQPEPIEGRREWFARHGAAHPVTVAEVNGRIVGWGSLSAYHARSAYRYTVENSVYVDHAFHRRGIGSALLGDLIERARVLGHRAIIAGIDADQTASIRLHAKFGFEHAGHLREVGFKFGRWLDVIYMQLRLGGNSAHVDAMT